MGSPLSLYRLYQGSSLAPALSNLVGLAAFDAPFKSIMGQHAVLLRYCDDMLLLCRDPGAVRDGMDVLHQLALSAGFEIHSDPRKTSASLINLDSEALRFLGHEILNGRVQVSDETYVDLADELRGIHPEEPSLRPACMNFATRLHFDPAIRIQNVLQIAQSVGPNHHTEMEAAIARVQTVGRTRRIAQFQSFSQSFLAEILK